MKNLIFYSFLLLTIYSCKKEEQPTPNSNSTSSASMTGDWYWYKTKIVTYDSNGDISNTNEVNYPAPNNHEFNTDGNIYIGTSVQGNHNSSTQATYTSGTAITFQVEDLTTTTMFLKEYPPSQFINSQGNFFNCSVQERYYQRP